MNYTLSNGYATDAGTGHRMHQDTAPVPTLLSAKDVNSVFWSLMQLLIDAGVAGADFDAAVPASYNRLSLAVQGLSGGAVGQVALFATAAVPNGWLECDGAAVPRTTYATLFARVGVVHGAGDGSTTFNLPDLRGEFVRGWDHGRGVDAGRAFGSSQLDALQNITGALVAVNGGVSASGAFAIDGFGVPHISTGTNGSDPTFTFDASRVARTAAETRPRSKALMYCIKT